MPGPFDYVNSIYYKKDYHLIEESEGDYNPFLTNRAMSMHVDAVFYANEMNQYNTTLTHRQQFDYYFHSIRKMRRAFAKWPKKKSDSIVNLISSYYKVNKRRAERYAQLLTDDQVKAIESRMSEGG